MYAGNAYVWRRMRGLVALSTVVLSSEIKLQPLLSRIQVNSPTPVIPRALCLLAFQPPHRFFIYSSLSHQYIIESWSCILNQKDWRVMK